MIDWLNEYEVPDFPPTNKALSDPQGLLAAGGLISPLWLDTAYRRGIFPWNDPEEARLWWTPTPRAVITPDSFHIPRKIAKELRKSRMRVTSNLAFERVMAGCTAPRDGQNGTWIDSEITAVYPTLQHSGRALSIECWAPDGTLAGGFYGLIIGRALFGESMFSAQSGASKIAFATEVPVLFECGIALIDCQMRTEHLARFGLIDLPRDEFEARLARAVNSEEIRPVPGVIK